MFQYNHCKILIQIIVVLIWLISTTTAPNSDTKFLKNSAFFVGELISKTLQDCKIFLIHGSYRNENSKPNFLWLEAFEKFASNSNLQMYSGGVTNLHLYNKTEFLQISRPVRMVSDSCSATIIILPSRITELEELLLTERLTKPFINPITIKNRDKFIFVTRDENIQSLYKSKLIQEIKFKLVLTEDDKGRVLAHRFCPYCPKGPIRTFEAYPAVINPDINIYFPDLQTNYHGSVLKLSATNKLPGLLEIAHDGQRYYAKRGVYASALNHLVEKLNFTYDLRPSSGGGSTGHPLLNGTWMGTVGDAYSGLVDFGFVAGMTYIRFPVIELCATITFEYISFAVGPPSRIYTWKSVFWPFHQLLWIGMIVSIILSVIAAYILLAKGNSTSYPSYERSTNIIRKPWNILSIVQFYGRSFIEQGDNLPVLPEAIRILLGFWLLFALVSATAYKSKMVSFMTFPILEDLPETFDELDKSQFKVTFHYFGNVAYNTFKTSTNPTFVDIFQKMEKQPDPLECLKETMQSRSSCILFGCVYDELRYRNLSDSFGQSPITLSPHYGFMFTPGVLHQKKAALSQNFKWIINTAMEMGLIGEWQRSDLKGILKNKNAWERETNKETFSSSWNSGKKRNDVLHLPNLIGAFTILIMGLVIAVIIFVSEQLYHHRKFPRLIMLHSLKINGRSASELDIQMSVFH